MPIAVVTGSSGGIGQAVCKTLVAEGYTVVGIDRVLCDTLDARVVQFQCDICELADDTEDISSPASKRGTSAPRALKALLASLAPAESSSAPTGPQLALLVNNAAYQVVLPFAEMTLKAFTDVMSTNLTAPFMLTKLLLPELQAARGAVVMVSSIHANLTKPGASGSCWQLLNYATSKGGLVTLTNALAVELGPLGVRVNAVLPAATNTPMLRAGFEGNPAGFEALSKFHPVGRICEPEEIAQFVAFLGDSKKSAFITGSALQIDGGIGGRLYDPA